MQRFTAFAPGLLLLLSAAVDGCHIDMDKFATVDSAPIIAANLRARVKRAAAQPEAGKYAIQNVRVFDGHTIQPPSTVVINGGLIDNNGDNATIIDGNGGILMPGLIDTHCHPANTTELEEMTKWGITTAFQMSCYTVDRCESLLGHPGLTDVKTTTVPAAAPGSVHGNLTEMSTHDPALVLSNITQVPWWMANQTSWNPDYVKLVAESPGLDQEILTALADAARQCNRLSVCHAAAYQAYVQAVTANVNHVHHAPLDQPVDVQLTQRMIQQRQISTPTLVIMQAIANKTGQQFSVATDSVRQVHAAGIPILAGTDSNQIPGLIAQVPFGISLHEELELLVASGLSPVEALRAATILPARHFGFNDRGQIATGQRADLLLLGSDPTKNISATRDIKRVWLAGIEYNGPFD